MKPLRGGVSEVGVMGVNLGGCWKRMIGGCREGRLVRERKDIQLEGGEGIRVSVCVSVCAFWITVCV